jgi:hypothetical protein
MNYLVESEVSPHQKHEKAQTITCKKTPGENSETMPSFPAKSTILKISITAGRAYFPMFKTNDQNESKKLMIRTNFQSYINVYIYIRKIAKIYSSISNQGLTCIRQYQINNL